MKNITAAPDATAGAQPTGLSSGNDVVDRIGQMHFEGNIVDHRWRQSPKLKFPSGRLNGAALDVLADVIYWHRPAIIINHATNQISAVKTRFPGEEFFRDYQLWADSLGLTKRQVQEAVTFLVARGIVTREVKTVTLPNGTQTNNVPVITPLPEAIEEITYGPTKREKALQRKAPHVTTGDPSHQNVRPLPPQRETVQRIIGDSKKTTTTALRAVDDVVDEKLFDDLTAAGVTPARARKLASSHAPEFRRRLEILPFLENVKSPGALLCANLDEPWTEPPALVARRQAEAADARAALDARLAAQKRNDEEIRFRQLQALDDKIDAHFKSLDAADRADVDERARERLVRVMGEARETPPALAVARRQVLKRELGFPVDDDEGEI
jgi:hypothetical protein